MSRRRLITERDVVRARREGAQTLAVGNAVVTPAARDAAAKFGIALAAATAAAPPAATPAPAASATPPAATPVGAANAAPAVGAMAGGAALRVVVGADHGGVSMKDALVGYLKQRGVRLHDVGTFGADAVDYPDFAIAVAGAVASGAADIGIMVDGAGIGSCMAANKVRGVRAAMCHDVTTAANAREHNNANVLTLGGTLLGGRLAQEIVRTFLDTPFGGGRHAPRIAKIDALDEGRS
ncbi:MAG: ribose 5-phosphate isomerase B [Gemmatimonadaceae bacterium]|nr:ribose 5-phosphate isomerase B [Gemmatimonadaceae bacterium]